MSDTGVTKTRTETDSMGQISVPDFAYWGAQTQRSLENFNIGQEIMPLDIIYAFALVKKAAAQTNAELGLIPENISHAIQNVCDRIMKGELDDHFPLKVWQTGSGTQTNMNVNEVIAHCATQLLSDSAGGNMRVHPNDHVNYGQSSNDCFPTAMHLSAVMWIHHHLLPALLKFQVALASKQHEFKDHIKIARTHLQDATPMRVGQEFGAFARQIALCIERLQNVLPRLYALAQGATAVGTGINTHPEFAEKFVCHIRHHTGIAFTSTENKFAAISNHDSLVELSGVLNTIACSYMKIAHDIRMLASGPRCGLGELLLPANEPGSSIMPGKVNPTQCEAMTMVAAQVMGNHTAITVGCSNSHFQLNTFKPLIAYNMMQSLRLLTDSANSFVHNCL
ncbi:MAG: class II fumarate hydratase, partial [Alphaproteobacteria bacterium]|nr:class II fumarate hydratase [Alphaproteobacteria bacterium]